MTRVERDSMAGLRTLRRRLYAAGGGLSRPSAGSGTRRLKDRLRFSPGTGPMRRTEIGEGGIANDQNDQDVATPAHRMGRSVFIRHRRIGAASGGAAEAGHQSLQP